MPYKNCCRLPLASACRIVRPLAGVLTLLGFAGVAQADTTPATGAYTTPTVNARLSSLSSVEGTATDAGSGVASVSVVLSRNWTGTNEYWTGTTWSGTSTPLSTTLGTADGNGQRTWTVTSTLPAGTDFRTGRYSLRATILDAAANSTNVDLAFYSGNDTTVPQGTLVPLNPPGTYSSLVEAAQSIFKGTVHDTGGGAGEDTLGRVQFRLVRTWTGVNEYWTGSGWSTAQPLLSYSLGTADGNGYKPWQVTAAMPAGADLASGRYTAQAIFIDTSSNTTTLSSSIQVTPQDTVNPLLSVTFPAEGANLSRLAEIRGTASDVGSGLALVNVRLRRVVGGQNQYWNGTAWTTSDFILTPRTDHTWVRNTNLPGVADLPAGAYIISAQATDRYNNSSTVVTRNFSIVANTVPNGVAQSVTAAKNVARPITLTSTEAQHDAVTYTTTNPSHGTLAGTAPNLIYTPASNYVGTDSFSFTPSDWGGTGTAATVSITVADDTTNPTATIETPAANAQLSGAMTGLSGTATDTGTGIGFANVQIYRDWGGSVQYWTGTAWTSTSTALNTTLGPDADGTRTWEVAFPSGGHLPSGTDEFPVGRYAIRVSARDYANRIGSASHYFYSGADSTNPTVTLSSPGASLTHLSTVSGTAQDADSGISQVFVRLRRISDNTYWNGTAWTASVTGLSTTLSAVDGVNSVNWTRAAGWPLLTSASLPEMTPGNYSLQPYAVDRSNRTGTGTTFNFTVIANTLPAATAQSMTAIGHYTRPGTPKGIALAATDADGDPIKSYHIVTQPLNGTVEIVGTTAIYIANTNHFGPDSFTFAARDWRGQNGTLATVDIEVVHPAPIDALIKNSAESDLNYLGDDIVNTDATNQTAEQLVLAGDKATYHIKVEKENLAQSIILKVFGDEETTGWTVRYFDAHTVEGLDITDDVTSEAGWQAGLTTNDVKFRLEVTAPTLLAEDEELPILISTVSADPNAATDVVKAVTTATPKIQPDLSIQQLDDSSLPEVWVGENIIGIGANAATISTATKQGATSQYAVRLHNSGSIANSFTLEFPATTVAMKVQLFDAVENGNEILRDAQGQWVAPLLSPGSTHELLLEITPLTSAPSTNVRLKVSQGEIADEVVVASAVQSISKLQWKRSVDEGWQDFPANGAIYMDRFETIGLKAVSAVNGIGWPGIGVLGPKWVWQGKEYEGGEVWLAAEHTTPVQGEVVTSNFGNQLSAPIFVQPDSFVTLDSSDYEVSWDVAGIYTTTATLSLKVVDENDAPLTNQQVRLRTLHGGTGVTSEWDGAATAAEYVVTTDAQGIAQVNLKGPKVTGVLRVEATTTNAQGMSFGSGDHVSIEVTQ